MGEEVSKIIKETTEELLKKMGFGATVELSSAVQSSKEESSEGNNMVCNISVADDSNFLIGQHGINLQSLQHIIRMLVRKKTEERVKFIVDVNFYRQQKNQAVIEQALLAAQQATSEKRAVAMKPMSSYERKIVHTELSKNNQIVTESIGEGENRKVVIKPANQV